jgi:hypothetical protein
MPFQKGGGTDWPIRIRRLPSPPPLTYHWHGILGLKLSPQQAAIILPLYHTHYDKGHLFSGRAIESMKIHLPHDCDQNGVHLCILQRQCDKSMKISLTAWLWSKSRTLVNGSLLVLTSPVEGGNCQKTLFFRKLNPCKLKFAESQIALLKLFYFSVFFAPKVRLYGLNLLKNRIFYTPK